MNLFKQKQAILTPFIVLLIAIIFSLTLASSVNPTPKNLPIAIVNEDMGVTVPSKGKVNMGNLLVSKIKEESNRHAKDDPAINWIQVSSVEKVRKGLNEKKYYAALILPSDLSQKQASLKTATPSSIQINILVNQGLNTNAANMASQMLSNLVDQLNVNIRSEIFNELEKNKVPISGKQANILASPIIKNIVNVNEVGTHTANGNAPVALITPLWMSSLIGAVLVFFAIKKSIISNSLDRLKVIFEQFILSIILSFVAGFGITLMAKWLGFSLPNFSDTALFLTIAFFSFHILISAVMSWIGLGGVGLFALIFFFSGSIIGMAPELLPNFAHDWIYSWVPMRFGADGLREIFFFDTGLSMSQPMIVLIWIASISIIVLFASVFKPIKVKKEQSLSLNS